MGRRKYGMVGTLSDDQKKISTQETITEYSFESWQIHRLEHQDNNNILGSLFSGIPLVHQTRKQEIGVKNLKSRSSVEEDDMNRETSKNAEEIEVPFISKLQKKFADEKKLEQYDSVQDRLIDKRRDALSNKENKRKPITKIRSLDVPMFQNCENGDGGSGKSWFKDNESRTRSFSSSEVNSEENQQRRSPYIRLRFSDEAKQENNVTMLKLAKVEQQLHEAVAKNKHLNDKLTERNKQLEEAKLQVQTLTSKLEREIQSSGELYNRVKELEILRESRKPVSMTTESRNSSLLTDNNDNEFSLNTSLLGENIEELELHLRRRSLTPIGDLMLSCTLCKERIKIQELESHSIKCSSGNASRRNGKAPTTPTQPGMLVATVTCRVKGSFVGQEDCNLFKVICKTTIPEYKEPLLVSERTKEDFLWFRQSLQALHPERVIPPLKFQEDLTVNLREIQRFLSRLCVHKVLKGDSLVRKFFEASSKELEQMKKNLEQRLPQPMKYRKPAVEVEDKEGILYKTQMYISQLLVNLENLVHFFKTNDSKTANRLSQCFLSLSEGEPSETYLKSITSSLSTIIGDLENKNNVIYDESILAEDLESILNFVLSADELLRRVESCVNTFLYWEEEIRVFEEMKTEGLVTSSNGKDITHLWAEASSNCRTAKDMLERMCRNLSEELREFDFRKEQELKQVFIEYAESRFDVFEKMQSKWFGVKLMLDTDIVPSLRAINFNGTPK